ALPRALAICRSYAEIRAALKKRSGPAAPARLRKELDWIDGCFAADSVEEIVAHLAACRAEPAQAALETMQKASPTSLKVTLRNIRSASAFGKREESFAQDYRSALASVAAHDFSDSVR